MKTLRFISFGLSIAFTVSLLFLASCVKQVDDIQNGDFEQNNQQILQGQDENQLPEVNNNTEPDTPKFKNALTGLETTESISQNRPVAIMINNIHLALPQIGISGADIIYEVLEEGGITRLMALYQDYENLEEIGSIRSARDYYIDISDAHSAIYVHCGGSTYAKDTIKQRKTEDIDGMYMGNFYRSKDRLKTMAYEHTLMISGEGLKNNIEQKGYSTSLSAQPLVFKQEESDITGDSASYIEIPFSLALLEKPYALSTFDYNNDSKSYYKSQYGDKHIDGATGEQLEFKNILILECKQNIISGDALGCIEVNFTGVGKGYYATNGLMKEIVWEKPSRTSSYTLYESDGVTPLELNPGKSYIAIVPTATKITAK